MQTPLVVTTELTCLANSFNVSCGAFSVGSPPSLAGCDWGVCGSRLQVISDLSEIRQWSGRSAPARGSPSGRLAMISLLLGAWLTCPTAKSAGPMTNSAGDHPTTHVHHSTV